MPRTTRKALTDWVAAGLIAAEQASAIAASEGIVFDGPVTAPPAPPPPPPPPQERRLPIAVEGLGYLGAVLALAGATGITRNFWSDLETAAQAALLALVTAGLLLAGLALRPGGEPALERLGSVLLFVSVGTWAGTAALLFVGDGNSDAAITWVLAATTLYGGAVWFFRRLSLQLTAWYFTILGLVGSVFALDHAPTTGWLAFAFWGLGVVWFTLGFGRLLMPESSPTVFGAFTAIIATFAGGFISAPLLVLGLATVAALFVAGTLDRDSSVIAMAGVGIAFLVPEAMVKWVGDSVGAPVALMLSGLGVIGAGVLVARSRAAVGATP